HRRRRRHVAQDAHVVSHGVKVDLRPRRSARRARSIGSHDVHATNRSRRTRASAHCNPRRATTTSVAPRRATGWIGRDARAVTHLLWAVVIGVLAGAIAGIWSAWQLAVLVGWGVAGAAIVARSWTIFARSDPDDTADHALMEDESRSTTHLVLLLA